MSSSISASPTRGSVAGDPVVVTSLRGAPKYLSELSQDVARARRTLERHFGRERGPVAVALLCVDRYRFFVGLLAAWSAGLDVVLPHNAQLQTLRGLKSRGAIRSVVHDFDAHYGIDLRVVLAQDVRETNSPDLQTDFVFDGDRTAVVVYTSGSTGDPTAHPKTFSELFEEVAVQKQTWAWTSKDVVLATVPPHHLYGLLFGVLLPWMSGAAFVHEAPALGADLGDALLQTRTTILVSVPAHLRVWSALGGRGSPLRLVVSSGQALPTDLFEGLLNTVPDRVVAEVLGSTETGGIAFRTNPHDPFTLLEGVDAFSDANGSLCIRSRFVAASQREGVTCADEVEFVDARRFLHHGRHDGVFKVAGTRVSRQEIEALARSVPNVVDAHVLVRASSARGTELWLIIEGVDVNREELINVLRSKLEPIAVPRRIRIVARLPRTSLGKPDRKMIAEIFEAPAGVAQ